MKIESIIISLIIILMASMIVGITGFVIYRWTAGGISIEDLELGIGIILLCIIAFAIFVRGVIHQ